VVYQAGGCGGVSRRQMVLDGLPDVDVLPDVLMPDGLPGTMHGRLLQGTVDSEIWDFIILLCAAPQHTSAEHERSAARCARRRLKPAPTALAG